jgi:hypothetical protein
MATTGRPPGWRLSPRLQTRTPHLVRQSCHAAQGGLISPSILSKIWGKVPEDGPPSLAVLVIGSASPRLQFQTHSLKAVHLPPESPLSTAELCCKQTSAITCGDHAVHRHLLLCPLTRPRASYLSFANTHVLSGNIGSTLGAQRDKDPKWPNG